MAKSDTDDRKNPGAVAISVPETAALDFTFDGIMPPKAMFQSIYIALVIAEFMGGQGKLPSIGFRDPGVCLQVMPAILDDRTNTMDGSLDPDYFG